MTWNRWKGRQARFSWYKPRGISNGHHRSSVIRSARTHTRTNYILLVNQEHWLMLGPTELFSYGHLIDEDEYTPMTTRQ